VTSRSRGVGDDGHPDLGWPSAVGGAGFAPQAAGVFEDGEGALDFAAFLVAAVMCPNQLCARG
jgi:hypothetical protein